MNPAIVPVYQGINAGFLATGELTAAQADAINAIVSGQALETIGRTSRVEGVDPDCLYTPEEAAARMHVSRATIFRLMQKGALAAVRVPGCRITRISERSIRAFLAGGAQ
jgi:excisionase family DNA binding protein